MKHKIHLSTKSYFINRTGHLSPPFMFFQMQDIAWKHSNILGFGYTHLQEKNQIWALSRIFVKIERLPKWNEEFILETWPRGNDNFFGYRDFNFIDKSGESIIKATSSWVVIDLNTKRMVRLSGFDSFPDLSESVFSRNADKVNSPESSSPLIFTPVLYSEIDINQHFNTGKFIERIIDSYNSSFHEKHELEELEMNFLKEGLLKDSIAIKKQELNNTNQLCSVVRECDGADLARARLVWKKK